MQGGMSVIEAERDRDHWKERYRTRIVSWTAPAASDRSRALAASNRTGVTQLYAWDVATNALRQVTHEQEGVVAGTISADGRWIHWVADRKGDEIGHWVRAPFEAQAAGAGSREALDLTPELPGYTSDDLATSPDGRLLAFVAAMDDGSSVMLGPDPAAYPDGEVRIIHRTPALCSLVGFSADGTLLYALSAERSNRARFSLLAFDAATGELVGELWEGEEASLGRTIASPLAGDPRVLTATDVAGDRRPITWNARTGERVELPLPDGPGEVIPWDWSPDGRSILLCRIRAARQQLSVLDLESGGVRDLGHAPGVYGFFAETGTWFRDDGSIVAQWQDSSHPATVVLLDGSTGHAMRDLLPPTPVPDSREWRSVTFPSTDGFEIQGWLLTPDGDGPFPAVVDTHGGPESVSMESFGPRAQSWADRGFAVLTVNYRGGTTFGRAFKEAIWGHPGELEVADMVGGRRWLVEHGIARDGQVFLTGWSYGGYLTLHALGTAPGLWAGGMAGVAVADWVTEYEDENDVLRASDRAFFGGTPSEQMEAYVKASPLTYVDAVDAPVLIVQGRNDTRCPARQVELYEAALRERGKPVEVEWFDAGHAAAADVERAIEHQERMLLFAEGILARCR
jgi:dipeptidyl aminopeptidase/acylaminoacyl peptidase